MAGSNPPQSRSREELVARLQVCARDGDGVLAESVRKTLIEAALILHEADERPVIVVDEGECLWLIETTAMPQPEGPQRHFWDGRSWNWNPLKAARYPSKETAEAVREQNKMYPFDKYPVCDHMFQCGVTPASENRTQDPAVPDGAWYFTYYAEDFDAVQRVRVQGVSAFGTPPDGVTGIAKKDIPEGRGSLPAGALESGSPHSVVRDANPGSAVPGGVNAAASSERPHYKNPLKVLTSEWRTDRNENEVTCHSRMVDGVLCRWWGDDMPPGVAKIDAAASASWAWKPTDPNKFPPVDVAYVLPRSIRKVAVYAGKDAWEVDLPPLPSRSDRGAKQ